MLEITISCNGAREKITAKGDGKLSLEHPTDMVVRKSSYICSRTLAICANKAAIDLDRVLVDELKKGDDVIVTLRIN